MACGARCVCVALLLAALGARGARHGFYRELGAAGAGTRRVFGGGPAPLSQFPAVCALLDRYWRPRCSCAVLAPRWALTAAHCVSPRLAYVTCNARRPAAPHGSVAPVHCLYRHPGYRAVQRDEGRGPDVTLLQHDVGLVRTRADLKLAAPGPPLHALRAYDPADLLGEEVQVLGFGRTERAARGEELFSVRLRLVPCERAGWRHCACAAGAGPGQRGVCSGDSGGPVLYRGVQVGVTSMGPVECALEEAGAVGAGATSVFTVLVRYADVINATIQDTDAALRMRIIAGAAAARAWPALLAPALLLLAEQ